MFYYNTILYYTILYYTILYYTILYYTILYYTILYYTILYYTILYYTILYYTILYCNSEVGNIVSHIRAAVDLRYIASAIPTLTGRKQFGRRNWTALLSRGLQKARTKPTPVLISPSPWCGGIFVHEMEPSHIPSCVTTRRQLSCAGHDQSQRRATQPRTEMEERRVHGLRISTFCCIIFFKPAYMCCLVLTLLCNQTVN